MSSNVIDHPYLPRDLSLPHYVPNDWSLPEILGVFFVFVGVLLVGTWVHTGRMPYMIVTRLTLLYDFSFIQEPESCHLTLLTTPTCPRTCPCPTTCPMTGPSLRSLAVSSSSSPCCWSAHGSTWVACPIWPGHRGAGSRCAGSWHVLSYIPYWRDISQCFIIHSQGARTS